MTDYYVRASAAGTNTGASWANAFTTWSSHALAAGDRMFVTEEANGAGTTGTTIATGSNKVNRPLILCVNHSGSVPPVSADLRTTGNNGGSSGVDTTVKGCFIAYGLTFNGGVSAGAGNLLLANNNDDFQTFDTCTLQIQGSAAKVIQLGLNSSIKGGLVEFFKSNVKFGGSGQSIACGSCNLVWRGGALQGTAPTTLFTDAGGTSTAQIDVLVEGVDLSLCTGTLVGDIAVPATFRFVNCLLGSAVTALATQTQDTGATVYILNSDSGSTNYRNEKHSRRGDQTTETTVVLASGWSDGTTAQSAKVATSANCDRTVPFEAIPFHIWCDSTLSAKTVTLELLTDGVTLKDNEAWAVLDTLQTSGNPQGTIATSQSDYLAAGSNLAAGAGTGSWTTTGLSSPVSQKIAFTFTPQKKGLVSLTLYVGKASTTVYASGPTALT